MLADRRLLFTVYR